MTDMWSFPGAAAALLLLLVLVLVLVDLVLLAVMGIMLWLEWLGGNCVMEGIVPGMGGMMIVVDVRAV